MKAVAYLRVSGNSQLDGEGWSRQLDAITVYARSHDIELVGTYREEAVPGKTELDGRPAFLGMLADLLSNGCRTIIVERLDRLAREFRVQEELLLYLMRKELTLISADTGEDITAAMNADPMRRFVVQLQGLLAELDKNLTVTKLAKARKAVRDRGGYAGGTLGYGVVSKRATVDEVARAEHERGAVRRVLELRGQGTPWRKIVRLMDAEGWRPRKAPSWSMSAIRTIAARGK